MTRLTPDMISDVPAVSRLDTALINEIGSTLEEISIGAAGISGHDSAFDDLDAAVIPVTSGMGVISGFSESVRSILESMGIRAFVTKNTDVAGFAEAVEKDADMIFMADDDRFIALNVRVMKFVDNTEGTAKGYAEALRIAMKYRPPSSVLVVGCGRVGSMATEIFSKRYASVNVVDIDPSKAMELERRYGNVHAYADVETAVRESNVIFNSSPGKIPGEWIRQGAVIISPGVPHSFDSEARRKANVIVHDPLAIGVGAMAAICAKYSVDIRNRFESEMNAINPISVRLAAPGQR